MQKSKMKSFFKSLLQIIVLVITYCAACVVRAVLTITFLNTIFRKKLFKYVETFADMKIENDILPTQGEENWIFMDICDFTVFIRRFCCDII